MIGFRNILVHDYLKIDRTIVFRVLQDNLGDLEALRRVFAQFL
ncbi:HepT-like ribonuclease domain-containing protein [Roseiflexus sp.]